MLKVAHTAIAILIVCVTLTAFQLGKTEDTKIEGEKTKIMLRIEKQLLDHEGFSPYPYKCTAGKTTIGIGRNLEDRGITMDEAMILLRSDIAACELDLYRIFGKRFFDLDDERKHALIDMRFNLGPSGFRKFKKMIKAVKVGSFVIAAGEMKKSLWWDQVGERARTLQGMMLKGDGKCPQQPRD